MIKKISTIDPKFVIDLNSNIVEIDPGANDSVPALISFLDYLKHKGFDPDVSVLVVLSDLLSAGF